MGGIGGGGFDDGGKACALGRAKLRSGYAEIGLCGGLDAIGAPAEINKIQIHFQYLILGALIFQLNGQPYFFGFPGNGFLAGKMAELNQLLGDGGGTLLIGAAAEIGSDSAQNADDIKAGMIVKTQIFCGKESVFYMFRHLG